MTFTRRHPKAGSLCLAAAMLAGLASLPVTGALAADAEAGRTLARIWCASCHVVEDSQESGSAAVPTFAEIARRPDFDEKALGAFLADPHPKMPGMSLTRREIADLSAYIAQRAP
ncbi:c-type cytochrome [Stappia stellulata]|uniref:c-type cytochrome n=1 Tax=Stappia stellulata TaxID=71235 RepID=UPI00041FDBD8|nr:c-type cytochrome [Stappia stellulata]